MRTYKPATFQPTIRPDWGGVLSYLTDAEKASILEAIIKYPTVDCSSKFWLETIKPDIDLQYEEFIHICQEKSRGVRNRWGKTSITPVKTSITPVKTSTTYVIDSEREREREGEECNIKEIKELKESKKFIPPTLEEIKNYVSEKKLFVDPDKFFAYFQEGSWTDSNGNRVRNWKQKLLTWDSKGRVEKTLDAAKGLLKSAVKSGSYSEEIPL